MSVETGSKAAEWLQRQSSQLSIELARRLTREARIARVAYARAARRGFEPGHEQEDWLAAEHEVDSVFDRGRTPNVLRD
ncbi:DUF2934 domain-containing protein [Methylolobus aquaticus]|uniref:DUF2934 domain-containing protein n=1 Tax=Methylotetracoccus oryzae TaxID=1919059 RepID=UPI001118878B|nr:DUF2934 domain-containing protein [Methylotetracoccus oryzae]